MSRTLKRKKFPLKVLIENGVLVIRIGINTLANAIEQSDGNSVLNAASGNCEKQFIIESPLSFACDVRKALRDEDEVGGTPVTRMLDAAGWLAIEGGSTAVREAGPA